MADFANGISDEPAGRRLARAIDGKGAFRRFKTNSTPGVRTCCQRGTRSGIPAPGAGPCNGWPATRSFTATPRTASLPGTQTQPCPDPDGWVVPAPARGLVEFGIPLR
jgi:hypothetical protein